MARIIYKAYPPDTELDKAVGILLPFNRNTYVRSPLEAYNKKPARDVGPFKLSYTTEEQAISNLINLLMTRKSERYMHPSFGTILRDFVFEQNSSYNRGFLETSLEEDIAFWLPYIVLKNLDVIVGGNQNYGYSESENSINVRITFSVTDKGSNRTIVLYNSGNDLSAQIL